MDRTALILGASFLVGGGILYYLISSGFFDGNGGNGGTQCSDYTTQSDCINNNCYWYDGSCHAVPQGQDLCALTQRECTPDLEGLHLCSVNNLCMCHNGEWVCVEESSQNCSYPFISHKKCFIENGVAECEETFIQGTDECNLYGEYCSCSSAECQDACYCAQDNRCIKKALYRYYEAEQTGVNCSTGPWNHWLEIPLEKPYAAAKIVSGKIWYNCANPIMDVINWSIWGEYNDESTLLIDGYYGATGSNGWFNIPHEGQGEFKYGPQAIETLLINCESVYSNVVPEAAYLTISFT